MIITVISVSAPAIRDTALYSRSIRNDGVTDVQFRLFDICGSRESARFDSEKACRDIAECDLLVLDLMGADDIVTASISDPLSKSKCSRIIISGFGPVKNKLGGYDEKRFKMDSKAASDVKLFSDYWKNSEGNDIASAFNMVLKKYFGYCSLPDPEPISTATGAFLKNPIDGRIYHSKNDYLQNYPPEPGFQTVIIFFNSHKYPMDSSRILKLLFQRISEFANVLPVAFNKITSEDIPHIRELIGNDASLAVSTIAFRFIAGPMGGSSTEAMKLLNELNVPFIRPFYLSKSKRAEWEERTSGLTVMEFMLNVFMAELDGALCTFPIGTNEENGYAEEFDIAFSEIKEIEDRLERLCNKIRGYLRLRSLPHNEKRIAIVGYNYPPGEGNLFGGAFLDTFSSMCQIADHLRTDGYTIPEIDKDQLIEDFITAGLNNGGDWTEPDEEKAIVFKGKTKHDQHITEKWGPAPGDIMTIGKNYFIPGVIKGNLFLGLQPARVSPMGDTSGDYHDPYIPPHHQYLAFYEWIRDEFKADAVIHIGTHGTVEFLPGKEVGMSGRCYPDSVIGDIPHYYLYYLGNPSEAMIAKRRTHAGLISYMSPPFVKSGLYGDLTDLESLIAEYRESLFADAGRSCNVLDIILDRARALRLPEDIDELEHELDDIRSSLIPNGFHIFGTPFTKDEAESFAIQSMRFIHEDAIPLETILSEHGYSGNAEEEAERIYREFNRSGTIPDSISEDCRTIPSLEFEKKVFTESQGCHELTNLVRALDSEFIDVKTGDDFLRNPSVLPSGYNIVQFDPNKIPTMAAFERGREAAENTIAMHLKEEGSFPHSVALVMWGLETSRSQGATIGQIMTYLGIRMAETAGSFEKRFEIIPIEELGRPRIDVTVSICGFFRDMFAGVVTGLNKVLRALWDLGESDEQSEFAKNTRSNLEMLKKEGYSDEDALDLAICRLFGPKEGLYGTGMTSVVNSSSWEDETDLGTIFENSLRHAYSLRYRGYDAKGLMSKNHSHVDVVSQIRQNVEYELIDLDHYYEFFGGLSKTVEIARGSKAKMYITDNTGPRLKTQNVKTSIEHGVRTRLLNPKWIDGMLKTDYHGTQKINDRFENVLGLAATTGAVDTGVFSDMENTYVRDEELRKRLRENNNFAYIQMLNRLYEAYNRGYWNASEEELNILRDAFMESEEMAEEESDR